MTASVPSRHRPVEPGKPVGCGIAGDAGIGDFGGDALGGERRLQLRHEAVLVGQAVSGRQRIAERNDFHGRCCRRRLRARSRACCHGKADTQRRHNCDLDQATPATHMIGGAMVR